MLGSITNEKILSLRSRFLIQSYPCDIDMSFYPKTSSSISQGQLAVMNHANEISLSGSFCFSACAVSEVA